MFVVLIVLPTFVVFIVGAQKHNYCWFNASLWMTVFIYARSINFTEHLSHIRSLNPAAPTMTRWNRLNEYDEYNCSGNDHFVSTRVRSLEINYRSNDFRGSLTLVNEQIIIFYSEWIPVTVQTRRERTSLTLCVKNKCSAYEQNPLHCETRSLNCSISFISRMDNATQHAKLSDAASASGLSNALIRTTAFIHFIYDKKWSSQRRFIWTIEYFISHFQLYNDLMTESINHLVICNLQVGGEFVFSSSSVCGHLTTYWYCYRRAFSLMCGAFWCHFRSHHFKLHERNSELYSLSICSLEMCELLGFFHHENW